MSIQYPPGAVEKLVGLFCRINATRPPSTPNGQITSPILGILVTKGMMRIQTVDNEIAVDIPHDQQVEKEIYYNLVDLLANELARLLGVPEFIPDISSALRNDGIIVKVKGDIVRLNPVRLNSRESVW